MRGINVSLLTKSGLVRLNHMKNEDNLALSASGYDPYRRIADPMHTILFLAVEAVLAYGGAIRTHQLRASANPDRIYLYARLIAGEWLLLAFVIAGLRVHGTPVRAFLGERWRSIVDFLRDLGIGLVFWMVTLVVISVLGGISGDHGDNRAVQFLLPHGAAELAMWLGVSVTAGICEEAIFRGYLQRQMGALAKNIPVGIVFSATMFGGAHLYQGWRRATLIGIQGVLFGMLAHWRKSVRPGIIAHAWQDATAPLLLRLVKH